jgi:hypothetical protein
LHAAVLLYRITATIAAVENRLGPSLAAASHPPKRVKPTLVCVSENFRFGIRPNRFERLDIQIPHALNRKASGPTS